MNITFIVPVLNGEKLIRQCIDSILAEMESSDEVLVVDNASTDSTVEIVRSYENVNLLICPELTVASLRNTGAASSENELLAFIDSDCVLVCGWRDKVVANLELESVDATGSLVEVSEDAGWIEKAWFSQKPDKKGYVKYINTGNLIVKRNIFNSIGGFDDSLISDEDCDFGERMNVNGYRLLEDPEIRVIHLDNPTTLKEFYLREQWHAISANDSFSSTKIDLPTLGSILFGVTILVSIVCISSTIWAKESLLWCASIVLMVPFITAIRRASQYGKYQYIPGLTLLWSIFYLVRIRRMVG